MGELYDVPGVTGRHSFSGSRVMVRALLRGRQGRDCTRAFRGRVWTARRVIVHSDGSPCLARVRWTLGVYGEHRTDLPVYGGHGTDLPVYGGHGTDLPWCVWRTPNGLACVWRTQDGLALVLSLMRAQAEYRLAFAVSGIRDVTVECTDVTVVWWCDVLWERRGPVG